MFRVSAKARFAFLLVYHFPSISKKPKQQQQQQQSTKSKMLFLHELRVLCKKLFLWWNLTSGEIIYQGKLSSGKIFVGEKWWNFKEKS